MKRLLAAGAAAVVLAAAFAMHAAPTEEEEIEAVITTVLEAYRTGDSATLGRNYAPEVTVVPGDYSPLIDGWSNVEPRYRLAYAAFAQLELLRENTRIARRGKLAWAFYQWRLAGARGKDMVQAQGHTTMILEKRGGHWLIVHNHTSMVPTAGPAPGPAPAAPPQP
ncbi:MAG: YybH family protein [Candidatus Acidiferrales bacterium]